MIESYIWNCEEALVDIRTMIPADYDAVYSLWINTPGMGLNNMDDSREGITRYLARNSKTCFVATVSGEIVGAILAGHDGRRGFIYHMAVAIPHREKGIGSNLLDSALNALRSEGIHKVALVVMDRNAIGNHFWEQKGFAVRTDLVYRNKALTELERIDT
jgi:ribosomal protein S18 acetylase RimI-like enzyme